jgi:hypothetical protein
LPTLLQNVNATCHCNICHTDVHVGFGGDKNFAQHEASKQHKTNQEKAKESTKQSKNLTSFFRKTMKPHPPSPRLPVPLPLPPTTSVIDVDSQQSNVESSGSKGVINMTFEDSTISCNEISRSTVSNSHSMLQQFRALVSNLPPSVPTACPTDVLAQFGGDLLAMARPVIDAGEDPWEVVIDPLLNRTIGYGKSVVQIAEIVKRGDLGMDGFCNWISVCLDELNISPLLLEMKLERVFDAMVHLYVLPIIYKTILILKSPVEPRRMEHAINRFHHPLTHCRVLQFQMQQNN